MQEFFSKLNDLIPQGKALEILGAFVTLILGLLLARIVRISVARLATQRLEANEAMILSRLVFYLLVGLVIASTLHQIGLKLGVLLGAAGIVTVALGFASQTSVSNLISGLFLIAERPFAVGDIIKIDDTTGIVLSVDLMSVKLRTFDNLFVRVPNELMIKAVIVNMTRFPIRRIDLKIGVAYKEDVAKVRDILFEIADHNPICLDEPEPLLIFVGFGDSSMDLQFSIWVKRENYIKLKNSIQEQIKLAFDDHGIEIPFPHRSFYTGSMTDPLPIQIVEKAVDEVRP